MLTSGSIARAFEMDREPLAVRERYGRHAFGQSLLLARRLVQAGVPVVQANMGRVQNWDTHGDNFKRLKNTLLPPLDQGVAALLDDLETTGLLDETLVMMLGEFGRTPKISGTGRDHWAAVLLRASSPAPACAAARSSADRTRSAPTLSRSRSRRTTSGRRSIMSLVSSRTPR